MSEAIPRTCGNCQASDFTRQLEQTNSGWGWLIAIVGLVFSWFLVGIPFAIYGVHIATKGTYWDVCNSCGTKLPAGTKISAVVYVAVPLAILFGIVTAMMLRDLLLNPILDEALRRGLLPPWEPW